MQSQSLDKGGRSDFRFVAAEEAMVPLLLFLVLGLLRAFGKGAGSELPYRLDRKSVDRAVTTVRYQEPISNNQKNQHQ